MEQVLLEVVQEQVKAWVAVAEEDEWEEAVQVLVQADIVYVQAAEQESLTSEAYLAIL
ncbi:MAG: hypothetical protein PVI33_03410 [Candidatus Omnitrophota bacterium]|jgi:hypothetical protein